MYIYLGYDIKYFKLNITMKNLFVPYELALLAKEKGFNDPCFGYYYKDNIEVKHFEWIESEKYGDWEPNFLINNKEKDFFLSAPIYQQLVDWFREKHDIEIIVLSDDLVNRKFFEFSIYKLWSQDQLKHDSSFLTYYEALNKALTEVSHLLGIRNTNDNITITVTASDKEIQELSDKVMEEYKNADKRIFECN